MITSRVKTTLILQGGKVSYGQEEFENKIAVHQHLTK
jgi:hypothetical protein